MSESALKYGPRTADDAVQDAAGRNNQGADAGNPFLAAYRVHLHHLAGEHENSSKYRAFVKRGELADVIDQIQEVEDSLTLSDQIDESNAERRAAQKRQILRGTAEYMALLRQKREIEHEVAKIEIEISRLEQQIRIARISAETYALRKETDDRIADNRRWAEGMLAGDPDTMTR